jgi:glycosyltransferase involved in cell wall biosynthesis
MTAPDGGASPDGSPVRVLVVATHPVQYAVPLYRQLAADPRIDLSVAFLSMSSIEGAVDPDFGMRVRWDVPMLEGYRWTALRDLAIRNDVHRFLGLIAPGLWRTVRTGSFDVVVLTGYRSISFWIGWAAARLSRARIAWVTDATTLRSRDGRDRTLRVKALVVPWIYRRGDAVVVQSTRGERFLTSIGVDRRRIHLVPYVVDNDAFSAGALEVDVAAVREAWGIPRDAFVALFVGKLAPWKRPEDLLRAAAASPDVWVVVAGAGEVRPRLEALAVELGIRERVRFLGFRNQSELPAVYRGADVLVLPSAFEPFGLVVNEAFACGIPAVVSDACGCADDLVIDGETGATYPAGDVAALAETLRALADPTRRRSMGERAHARIEAWGPEASHEASVELFWRLAGRARRG